MKITICGLAGAGKGTIARRFATEAKIGYVDLGLLFRFGTFALETGAVKSLGQLLDSSGLEERCMHGKAVRLLFFCTM